MSIYLVCCISLFINNQIFKLTRVNIMMHYSTFVYESQENRRNQDKKKNPAKTNGSYFQAPLVQKTLSTKPLSYRNVFRAVVEEDETDRSRNHFLDLTPLQSTTMKTMNIQKLSLKNKQVKKAFRRHYRIDIKDYLKRRYRKQAYQIPLQAFELLRFVDEKQINEPFKTTFAYVYKPFYINDNLKRRIENDQAWNKAIFKPKSILKLFRQLLKCSIQFGGLDNFIMTTSNVYMQQNLQTLQINYTSFTGLGLLKCQSTVGAHEYFQVLPYFTQNMINTKTINTQDRIRFFLINCLCLINKKDFVVDVTQQVEAEAEFTFSVVKSRLKDDKDKIAKQFEMQIKSITGQKKKAALARIKMNDLLIAGLVKGQTLTWDKIVRSICTGQPDSQKQQIAEADQPNEKYGQQIEESFRKLHEQLFEAETDKQFYQQRGLDTQLLYIPVKYQADLALVFEKKAWWEIFNVKNKAGQLSSRMYNILHENFCFRLLEAVIARYPQKELTPEWAQRFKSDITLQIMFTYLNACEYPSIIILNQHKKDERAILFTQVYQKYINLKQNASK